jgi:hypothetical protein
MPVFLRIAYTGAAMLDPNKLAVIHIVKKELNLSDTEYRDTLEKFAGVRSAKDLGERGFRKLMNYFARSKYYRAKRNGISFRQKMFIRDLKAQLDWDDPHFKNFLKKYYKKESIETFSKKEAGKLIESLKNVLKHQRAGEKENSR